MGVHRSLRLADVDIEHCRKLANVPDMFYAPNTDVSDVKLPQLPFS